MTGLRILTATATIALVASLAGCSGKKKDTTTVKTGSGTGLTSVVKKTVLSWGFTPAGDNTDVFLATTTETGAQQSYPVGTFPGTCEKFTVEKQMNALTSVQCKSTTGITQIHAVKQNNEIILMKLVNSTDPMAREEIKRVTIDLGSAIEVAP